MTLHNNLKSIREKKIENKLKYMSEGYEIWMASIDREIGIIR